MFSIIFYVSEYLFQINAYIRSGQSNENYMILDLKRGDKIVVLSCSIGLNVNRCTPKTILSEVLFTQVVVKKRALACVYLHFFSLLLLSRCPRQLLKNSKNDLFKV